MGEAAFCNSRLTGGRSKRKKKPAQTGKAVPRDGFFLLWAYIDSGAVTLNRARPFSSTVRVAVHR